MADHVDTVTAPAPHTPRTPDAVPAPHTPDAVLGPLQRAYLVGDQEGLELRGPARYYVACELPVPAVDGVQRRLDRLVRQNPILRTRIEDGLTPAPVHGEAVVPVTVLEATEDGFDALDSGVREEFSSDGLTFEAWPQLRLTVVRSARRARLHLVYTLWLMDAASLARFLEGLVHDTDTGTAIGTETGTGTGTGSDSDSDSDSDSATVDRGAASRAGRRRERDERYWRAVAPALPETVQAPLRPDWRHAGRAVTHRMLHLGHATTEAITRQANRHGLTLPMVFLTVYGTLLGSVGGGRPHTLTLVLSPQDPPAGTRGLGNRGIAMPVAIPAAEGRDVVSLAREVQGRVLEQSLHQSLSGPEIARLADPAGGPRRLPYPFAFTATEVDTPREAALGLRRDWDTVHLRVPQVLLDHQVVVDGDGTIRLGFDGRTDAFDDGFLDAFVEQYAHAVDRLAADGADWTGAARRTRSAPCHDRPAPPGGATLQQRVLETVERTPHAHAVRDGEGTLTYEALADAAAELARRLVSAGAETGDHVAIHLPRGRGQVVAILGTLLAGCVYVPLDWGLPRGRLDRITDQAGLRFAVTAHEHDVAEAWHRRGVRTLAVPATAPAVGSPAIPTTVPGVRTPTAPTAVPRTGTPAAMTTAPGAQAPTAPTTVPGAQASAAPATASGVRRLPEREAADIAYVIFTSGSTGEPKGVVIRHDAVLNTLDAVNDLLRLGPSDSVLSVSSLGFDLSVYDIFGPLLVGATVVVPSEDDARTPSAWTRIVTEHAVTVWNSAPALAALLAEEGGVLASVRSYLLSGDWIPLHLPAALEQRSAGAQVLSLGGATEGSIWSIHHQVTPADRTCRSIPYGKPLAGQDILVLDAQGAVCADWHIGEIHIAGRGVADGYLNDPRRTAKAFYDHPEHGWVYRTGDRGRRGPDGVVEILGRIDTQVKVNGYRVELGEIEALLDAMPHVRRSAACVPEDGGGVLACVTLSADAPADWRARSFALLREELPAYMVPYALVDLDELPLTANGKVDHRRLRTTATPPAAPAPVASRPKDGPHAQEVRACWSELMGREPGGEGFFDSGGSSLDAIRLLSMLRSRFGYAVPFGRFLADPTVKGLAQLCGAGRGPANEAVWSFSPRPVTRPRGRVVFFPPVGGGVACYAGLIRTLPADLDIHVLGFDRPCDTVGAAAPTLAALTDLCLRHLKGQIGDPDVPCVVLGWSFGGALAAEATRAAPYPITKAVLLDTPVSAAARHCEDVEPRTVAAFTDDIRRAGNVTVSAEAVRTDAVLRQRFAVYRQNLLLLRDWQPGPVPVPLVQFRAGEQPAEPDPGAWRAWAPGLRTRTLTGGHFDVFRAENLRHIQDEIESGLR
ncbi:AMP-binding protein [Streptomyces sp. NPDC015532]|uniref:non-ribosomal peptide synthetase n=1 Tax=Streptomyces sp. NPDC015532 TaxID=3364960 RepID=UPI0036F5596B